MLNDGRRFVTVELTSKERALLQECQRTVVQRQGECFVNAQQIVLNDSSGRLKYAEGFIEGYPAGVGLPVHHGWVAIGNKAVEVTLLPEVFGEKLPESARPKLYHGVEFDRETLGRMLKDRTCGPLLDVDIY